MCYFIAAYQMIQHAYLITNKRLLPYITSDAKKISTHFLGFSKNTQQDAHEYFLKMMDS
jgi:hypothetical protein